MQCSPYNSYPKKLSGPFRAAVSYKLSTKCTNIIAFPAGRLLERVGSVCQVSEDVNILPWLGTKVIMQSRALCLSGSAGTVEMNQALEPSLKRACLSQESEKSLLSRKC